jgi:hypothetical protein
MEDAQQPDYIVKSYPAPRAFQPGDRVYVTKTLKLFMEVSPFVLNTTRALEGKEEGSATPK